MHAAAAAAQQVQDPALLPEAANHRGAGGQACWQSRTKASSHTAANCGALSGRHFARSALRALCCSCGGCVCFVHRAFTKYSVVS
jgi:hypothetical protein